MRSNHDSIVAGLFDQKAKTWDSKYDPDGPLWYRAAAFSELLRGHVKSGDAVLDFGGGTGVISKALTHQGFRMTVCDISQKMLATGKEHYFGEGIDWVLLPKGWNRLPFEDCQFDAVIGSSVFEYLEHPENALIECGRVLRQGGKLIFSVPNPRTARRRLERALRPVALLALRIPLVGSLPRIGDHLRYLQISRNRFSQERWRQKASVVGLQHDETSDCVANPQAPGMIFLRFERSYAD